MADWLFASGATPSLGTLQLFGTQTSVSGVTPPTQAWLTHGNPTATALLTFNTQDFVRLDSEWKAVGRRHAGIVIVARPVEIGHLIRCVMRHLDTVTLEVQTDVLLWLDTSLPC